MSQQDVGYCIHCGSKEELAHIKYYNNATGDPVRAVRCSSNPCSTDRCHHFIREKKVQYSVFFGLFRGVATKIVCDKCGEPTPPRTDWTSS